MVKLNEFIPIMQFLLLLTIITFTVSEKIATLQFVTCQTSHTVHRLTIFYVQYIDSQLSQHTHTHMHTHTHTHTCIHTHTHTHTHTLRHAYKNIPTHKHMYACAHTHTHTHTHTHSHAHTHTHPHTHMHTVQGQATSHQHGRSVVPHLCVQYFISH